jgi:hypothetical protein
VDWLPVFVSEVACKIVTDSLAFCHEHKGLRTNACVIMPTHLHAIVFHESFGSEPLRAALAEFRKFTGRQLSDYCSRSAPPCFVETLRQASGEDRERRFWQPTRHPEVIETEAFWRQKLDYTHDNPCRKGLVRRGEHWRLSSASYYASDGREPWDVPLSRIAW